MKQFKVGKIYTKNRKYYLCLKSYDAGCIGRMKDIFHYNTVSDLKYGPEWEEVVGYELKLVKVMMIR